MVLCCISTIVLGAFNKTITIRKSVRSLTVAALFLLVTLGTPLAARAEDATHPFCVHDMLAMDRISDPQVSPDGNSVVFVLRKTDLEANKGRTDLWMVRTDGSDLRRITSHPASERNPRWSPDGKWIYFLAARGDNTQVWRIARDGGEAEQVTKQPLDVGAFVVSHDGLSLAIAMEVFPAPLQWKQSHDWTKRQRKSTGHFDKLLVRHWDSWKDGLRSHVFAVPVWEGEAIDVMKAMDADCPSKPFGGPEEFTFAPDDRSIIFTSKDANREEAWSTNFDLFAAPVDNASPPLNLTDSNDAWDTAPNFSPNGKLAFLAMARPGYEADRYKINVKSSPAANALPVTADWDRSPGAIAWSADESSIYATADNLGQHSLFEVIVATGAVKTIVQDGNISDVQVAGDRIVFLMDHLKSPAELYSVKPDGSDVKPITKINEEKIAAARMGDFEQFHFKGWHDETVYGYVVKPVDFDGAKKYPVAFVIHGGPQGSFGNHFHYRWNPQAYAAGYGVVMVDFHGSTGYGQGLLIRFAAIGAVSRWRI
jgi:dipeptidyl aminopeptidase/acylaminoacyl peptidase